MKHALDIKMVLENDVFGVAFGVLRKLQLFITHGD